jgi:hypothetical protein
MLDDMAASKADRYLSFSVSLFSGSLFPLSILRGCSFRGMESGRERMDGWEDGKASWLWGRYSEGLKR